MALILVIALPSVKTEELLKEPTHIRGGNDPNNQTIIRIENTKREKILSII